MQVYPAVVQFDTGTQEAAGRARLAQERRAATARPRSSRARRLSLGLSLVRARSAQTGQAAR